MKIQSIINVLEKVPTAVPWHVPQTRSRVWPCHAVDHHGRHHRVIVVDVSDICGWLVDWGIPAISFQEIREIGESKQRIPDFVSQQLSSNPNLHNSWGFWLIFSDGTRSYFVTPDLYFLPYPSGKNFSDVVGCEVSSDETDSVIVSGADILSRNVCYLSVGDRESNTQQALGSLQGG